MSNCNLLITRPNGLEIIGIHSRFQIVKVRPAPRFSGNTLGNGLKTDISVIVKVTDLRHKLSVEAAILHHLPIVQEITLVADSPSLHGLHGFAEESSAHEPFILLSIHGAEYHRIGELWQFIQSFAGHQEIQDTVDDPLMATFLTKHHSPALAVGSDVENSIESVLVRG